MTRARSLADELAELVNPAPQAELDPEAAAITEHDAPVRDDDELAGLVAGAAAGRRGIQADIAIEGGQYSGRRSSRAALFGDGGDVSDPADTSDSEGALVPVQGSQRAPSIDYATIPTMFVNGHMNGPGPDDTTSSSSTLGDSQDQETSEDSQQQQQQQQINTTVDNQQEDGHHHVTQSVAQQEQQQQQQLLEAHTPDHHASSGDEQQPTEAEALGSSEQQDPQQQQQRDSGIVDDQEVYQSDSEDQGRPAAVDDVAAAAGAVAAMLGDDAEMQQLESEAAAAQAEASQQLVAAAAGSSRDAAKAAGVRAQQRLWGAALECRIRLQKAVAGANVMPRPAAAATFKAADKQIAKGYSLLLSACQSTLEEMLHLHSTLAQQHPAAAAAQAAAAEAAAAPPSSKKRSREADDLADHEQQPHKYVGVCSSAAAAWQAVDAAVNSLAGFRDASLDKWHRRTVLSSGTAALRGSSGLRALQQSVSSQVAALMSDQHKLINRSQLPRQLAPRPLGQTAAAAAGGGVDSDDDDAEGAGGAGARDPETYDEGDFYQQLLKELIESAPGGSLGDQLAAARPAKRRKLVDRRASKGRKLRYHTLDKLVGFMAPTELSTPPFAQQLFANLFTHEG